MTYNTTCYILCEKCGHGSRKKGYNWTMTYFEYLYEFLVRMCPKCKFHDTANSMGPSKPSKFAIRLEAIDY